MASIYDNPAFEYKKVNEGDYFSFQRQLLKEQYGAEEKNSVKEAKLRKEANRYTDEQTKDSFKLARKRLKEDYSTTKENINNELASISQRTYQRYIKKGAHAPTQVGLQNLAMRNSRVEKDRQDYMANRSYDRSLFDLGVKETQMDWQSAYQEKLAQIEQNKSAKNINIQTNEALLNLNKKVSDWGEANTLAAMESGVFSQQVLGGEQSMQGAEVLPEEYKFNSKDSYGY